MSGFLKIALLLGKDLGYCRGVMRGIQQFTPASSRWVYHDVAPDIAEVDSLKEWNPAGIIAHLYRRDVARMVARLDKPVVNVTYTLTDLKLPLVEVDHVAVGRMAAEYLMQRGLRNFGFFGSRSAGFSRLRRRGFRERLARSGFRCANCDAEFWPQLQPGTSWMAMDVRVLDWLRGLPKPVGLLASNDVPARQLAEVCRQSGLRVPEDIALLGVDNDDLECSLSYPPLSSIAIPAERIGYEAAALLDQMLSGSQPPRQAKLLPPVNVVTRHSTDVLAIADPELVAAIRYIHDHANGGLTVEALLRAVPMARRTLEKRFRKVLGRSPLEEIRRIQVQRVQQLLVDTNLSVAAIAQRAGFETSQRLAVVFRDETGLTCSAYRRQFRADEFA